MYVSMILGENYLSLLETRKFSGKAYLFFEGQPIALYEKMPGCATSPDVRNRAAVDMISMRTSYRGFIELYETFKKAVRIS